MKALSADRNGRFSPGRFHLDCELGSVAHCPENPVGSSLLETKRWAQATKVSTALAAGLASLAMYLPRLVQTYHEHIDGMDSDAALKFAGYAAKLRTRENMKRAFDNITDQSHEDKKFLPVWHMFGRRAGRIIDSQALGARSNKLGVVFEELVTDPEVCGLS
ncbi:hypothetical protein LA080_000747 [Diaporthe eres]|nr:hypothetical protein LA080_000747 [Diaporthe eres]